MALDENVRALERSLGPTHPRVLGALARVGTPRACVFCDHALTGEEQCSHQRQYVVGDRVVQAGVWLGSYLGDNQIVVNSQVHVVSPSRTGIVELPEAWRPAPCGCDHRGVPEEATREAYEAEHGVDYRVMRTVKRGQILYDVVYRNRDQTPLRWVVNGEVKRWKRQPERFRVPVKRGMYDYGHVTDQTCRGYRTSAVWAMSYGERNK